MNQALRDLYQELILDHNRNPRNHYCMKDPTFSAIGHNPLCGDKLELYLYLDSDNKIIQKISFMGCGCAISQASASLMTEAVQGKTFEDALFLFGHFHGMLTETDEKKHASFLGKLAVFQGVRAYPARVKCATLPWHTLQAALSRNTLSVTTE